MQSKMLESNGIRFTTPPTNSYPLTIVDIAEVARQLRPSGAPAERRVNGKIVYNPDGVFLTTSATLAALAQAESYEAGQERLCKIYEALLEQRITEFQTRYNAELAKKKPFPLNLVYQTDTDYLLVLAQHLHDLQAARNGQSFHALTAELKILASFAHYGEAYFAPYPEPPVDPGTNRAVKAPDHNLVFDICGFQADWQTGLREAYALAYKLGYPLEDIYVFSYAPGATEPIRLSEVVSHDFRFIGDTNLLVEAQQHLKTAKGEDVRTTKTLIQRLLDKNNQRLRHWLFTSEDNLGADLHDMALAVGVQLRSLSQSRPGQRINLTAISQGAGIAAGFLLQEKAPGAAYILEPELAEILDKYVLTVPTSGGAYIAQAINIADKTGPLLKIARAGLALLTKIAFGNNLIEHARRMLTAPAMGELAITSAFTQANYAQLQGEAGAASALRLHGLKGLEIFAANDEVAASVPLLPLPATGEIRMRAGRHVGGIIGNGAEAYSLMNKYIYPHFAHPGQNPPDLTSDRLIHSGYLQKGLPDSNPLAQVLPAWLHLPSPLLFLSGRAGVIDYAVMEKVYNDLGKKLRWPKPQAWPAPTISAYKP